MYCMMRSDRRIALGYDLGDRWVYVGTIAGVDEPWQPGEEWLSVTSHPDLPRALKNIGAWDRAWNECMNRIWGVPPKPHWTARMGLHWLIQDSTIRHEEWWNGLTDRQREGYALTCPGDLSERGRRVMAFIDKYRPNLDELRGYGLRIDVTGGGEDVMKWLE